MGPIRPAATAIALCFALCVGASLGTAQSKDSAKISSATPEVADDEAFAGYQRVIAGIAPPKAIHSPDPEYPDVPTDTEPRGVVVMLIGVDTRGHVGPVHVVRSSAQAFEKSAVATVKTWRFKPAKKEGKAVPVQITVEMNFAK
jgi:protein TonB